MYREMRRKNKELSIDEINEVLTKGEYGVLSTTGHDGEPYGVPLSYTYYQESIYFHGAKEGHKIDNLKNQPKISFCVVTDTEIKPSSFTTSYKSVIVFGKIVEVCKYEKEEALLSFIEKYSKEFLEEGKEYVKRACEKTNIMKIDIEHITGKQNK